MPVYFIRSGDTGPVKIGWADDVEKRRGWLQTGHPYPLQVVRVIQCRRGTERWLQKRYEGGKLLGEWYAFDASMLTVEPPDLPTTRQAQEREAYRMRTLPSRAVQPKVVLEPWMIESRDIIRKQIKLDRLVEHYDRVVADYRRRNGHG